MRGKIRLGCGISYNLVSSTNGEVRPGLSGGELHPLYRPSQIKSGSFQRCLDVLFLVCAGRRPILVFPPNAEARVNLSWADTELVAHGSEYYSASMPHQERDFERIIMMLAVWPGAVTGNGRGDKNTQVQYANVLHPLFGYRSEVEHVMVKENPQPNDKNKARIELSEVEKDLVRLVAAGLTDDEIAKKFQIPKHDVWDRTARLLAKFGARDRVEIVLYAPSDPTMSQPISTEISNTTTKSPQAQTPGVKDKAS
jgi:DNA-binding CsgD family transcriptional regulator